MATRDRTFSNVFLYAVGDRKEYAIDYVDVLVTATTQIGDVLYDNAGTFTLVDVANTANAAGVLVDERLLDAGAVEAGTVKMKVARRACGVGANYLQYAADVDTTAEVEAVQAALLAAGIKVHAQF